MRYYFGTLMVCLILFSLTIVPVAAQSGSGMSVQCQNGVSFDNGVEVTVVQMRSGYTYTATAIGLNGFDPVLAVLDATGEGLCTDDDQTAAAYSASLPTTGYIAPQSTNAQIHFANNSGNPLEDVSLIVGGFGNQSGEFLLILEGMAVTSGDGAGDPFSIEITSGMAESGVPLTAYMISVTDQLDPLMIAIDGNYEFLADSDGNYIACDDAGDPDLCWGESTSLAGSYVSRTQGRQLGGYGLDGMLKLNIDSGMVGNYFNLLMRSSGQQTLGDYLVVFHVGIGSGGGDTVMATPVPAQPQTATAPSGMSVECQNGVSFDNGVEVTVIQMRSGYTYTATAIGLNGFDPVLAVLDTTGEGLCTDDDETAAAYSASLPTTGYIAPQSTNAQIHFANNSGNPLEDVSLIVGGFGNQSGEFLLILEGMAVTSGDGAGDPFSIRITPGMVASGVPLTAYMISVTDQLDPLMIAIDGNYEFLADSNGDYIACDDAGDPSMCWGQSSSLAGSYVSRTQGRQLGGYGLDGMLVFDLDPTMTDNYINLLMRSSGQQTLGDYLVAFHMGIGEVLLPGDSA